MQLMNKYCLAFVALVSLHQSSALPFIEKSKHILQVIDRRTATYSVVNVDGSGTIPSTTTAVDTVLQITTVNFVSTRTIATVDVTRTAISIVPPEPPSTQTITVTITESSTTLSSSANSSKSAAPTTTRIGSSSPSTTIVSIHTSQFQPQVSPTTMASPASRSSSAPVSTRSQISATSPWPSSWIASTGIAMSMALEPTQVPESPSWRYKKSANDRKIVLRRSL